MKKAFLIAIAVVLIMSTAIMGCPPPPPPNDIVNGEIPTHIVLDFASLWAGTHFQVVHGHKHWARIIEERVEAETPHTVEWFWYYAVPADPRLAGLRAGTYDVISGAPGYYPGVYPLAEVFEMAGPLHRKNALTMSMAIQRVWDEFAPLRAEFAAREPMGVVMLFWTHGEPWLFMNQHHNITSLADFPGNRIRVPTVPVGHGISDLGGHPVSLPMGVVLENLAVGLLEGLVTSMDAVKGWGLFPFVYTAVPVPFLYQLTFYKMMNRATWDALPPSVQTIIEEVNDEFTAYYGKLRVWAEHDALIFCRGLGGPDRWFEYDLATKNPAEYARWIDATDDRVLAWIAVDPATRQAIWDEFRKWDAYYATTAPWSTWTTPYPDPPPPPTFP
jgi:TRAP-type C4-dicarboxylate transport system substrate-binding protein